MRIIEPHQLNNRAQKRKPRPLRALSMALILVIALWLTLTWLYYYRFLPIISPIPSRLPPTVVAKHSISWPDYGQAAISAEGYGLLDTSSAVAQPHPIASVTKIITALAVLEKQPLNKGEQGLALTMTDQDLALYRDYLAKDGSVVPVAVGEQLSEYQALQAMLLPSANNIADTLARWAFDSDAKYVEYANRYVKSIGMKQTTVAGASGFSGETFSTASDLAILGLRALKNPVVAEIVAQNNVILPVVGEVRNVNWLLGQNGINGIKTGHTDEAGGCFLVSAKRRVASGQTITIVAAIVGAPSLWRAMGDAPKLLDSAFAGFSEIKAVTAGQKVGNYRLPWGGNVAVVAQRDIKMLIWQGSAVKPKIVIQSVRPPAKAGQNVGLVSVSANGRTDSSGIVLQSDINTPPAGWRLRHL